VNPSGLWGHQFVSSVVQLSNAVDDAWAVCSINYVTNASRLIVFVLSFFIQSSIGLIVYISISRIACEPKAILLVYNSVANYLSFSDNQAPAATE
jgi:hypothetical protein